MNNYQKLLYASAFSAVLAGGLAPAFAASASDADPAPAVSRSAEARPNQAAAPSSYSLHVALFRAPTSPAAPHPR